MSAALAEPTPRVLPVTPGDPTDATTWSGIARQLCRSFAEHDALAGAVDGRWQVVDYLEKALTYSRSREVWRQRHSLLASPLFPAARAASSAVARRRVHRAGGDPDALLQIGARIDLSGLPGVLHCSYHDSNLALALRRPDLVTAPDPRAARRVAAFERSLYDRLDLIFVMSDWLRRSFIEDFGQPPEKVVTVGAGANLDPLPEPPEVRDFSRPRFLFVGRHFERKGGEHLLAAFRTVRASRPDAELWIVGPDQPVPPAPGVRFIGPISRRTEEGEAALDRVYREATTFVMPSQYEPFGIVFLEAMAYGLPCVGAWSCAMPEIIEEGVTGYLAAPRDADGLAERLLALAGDPDRAAAAGAAGRARLVERFTWSRVAERMLAAIARRERG